MTTKSAGGRARRLGAGAAAAGLLTAGAIAWPATATPAAAELSLSAPEAVNVAPRAAVPARGGATAEPAKTFQVSVAAKDADGDAASADGVKVAIDLSGLAGAAEVTLPANCTPTGTPATSATCDIGTVTGSAALQVAVRAVPGAPADTTGTLSYQVTAGTARAAGTTAKTQITVRSGADLLVQDLPPATDVPAGTAVDVPVTVTNTGDRAALGVSLFLNAEWTEGQPERVDVPVDASNCRTGTTTADGEKNTGVYCTFDNTVIKPGQTYRLFTPLKATVGKNEPGAVVGYGFDVKGGERDSDVRGGTPGKGPRLKLVRDNSVTLDPRQALGGATPVPDLNAWDNTGQLAISVRDDSGDPGGSEDGGSEDGGTEDGGTQSGGTGGKTPDLAAVGASVKTEGAATVKAAVGVENAGDGPASAAEGEEHATYVVVEVPRGATVKEHQDACREVDDTNWAGFPGGVSFGTGPEDIAPVPGGDIYYCDTSAEVAAGAEETFAFEFDVARVTDTATGLVYAASGFGDDQKNNLGSLVITATDAPATTGPTTGGATPATTAAGASAGSTGGGLASTGSDATVPVAGAAAGAVVLGGALYLVFRRRSAV